MNDLDLSRPATRQRTSNTRLPALRRIAKILTSNELMRIPRTAENLQFQPTTPGTLTAQGVGAENYATRRYS